jgi:hypothetical protein
VFKRFSQLNNSAVDKDKNAKLKRDEILELPELKVQYLKYCQINMIKSKYYCSSYLDEDDKKRTTGTVLRYL